MIKRFAKLACTSIAVITIVFATSGCRRNSAGLITLAGSTAFQPFAEKLAEKYMEANKDVRINVQGGGSAVGIQSALSGAANIGMADLLKLPPEASVLTSTTVAKDGIAIVVHPQNPIRQLTSSQARDVFAGRISNWKELGGADASIHVISREEGSGTRRSFDTLVLGEEKLTPNALFQNSNGTIREAVANDTFAIGYVSIGLVNDKVKEVSLNGVAPSNENVKKGTYPLSRPVFFLTKGEPTAGTKKFIDYVLSEDSQKLLEKEGLIAAK